MASPDPDVVYFDPDEPAEVLQAMSELAEAHVGWVNLEPEVIEEHIPTLPSGLARLFSARGPQIPLCTWTPGEIGRNDRLGPETVGVQHSAGMKVRPLLEKRGHPVPDGWAVRSDHPKRGLVAEVPLSVGHWSVVRWLVAAGETLSLPPTTGRWIASIHRR